ncbi:hypothetical protein KC340_g13203 [Hortaea werneckii]|nr:hypothetical protein KC361_g9156 [Hortaea werneckii]KAI7294310.1 hypothetical protein KC352_g1195 [Hortaea werneckii]KAI7300912.1 hypothetical protein KC340_g13203 [Hortaea werneckii]KAI7391496.1 hypothetical protein KC328_g7475 [Hortaea werneckii]KAI7724061.1 hypothetical protein KC322_g347 [Hortaea werneckii]
MEHTNEANVDTQIKATIIPSNHRDEKSKEEMRAFIRHLSGFQQLSAVIEAAGELMGLKGYGTVQSGPAFGQDVLRIKVCGNTGLNLTIVDLPGIIQVPNDEQDDNDVDTVHSLVDSYVANPRTIILAVVQAGNDISNQPIIKKSKKFDKDGERTFGVITKPDLINDGTQARIAALSRNEDTTKLKLGFFMMKNPSPKEMQHGISMLEREQKELTYFSSPPWKDAGLDMSRLGVGSLRMFFQDLLSRHTEREMPKVREEVRSLLKYTEKSISRLGEERPTTSHRRIFLSRLAMRYHNLTNAALIGDYDSSEFEFFNTTSSSESRRLRAFVHSVNTTFSDKMRLEGTTLKVVSEPDVSDEDAQILDLQEVGSSQDRIQQMSVSDAKYTAWIRHVYSRTRGRELPGNYNHVLLAELFHFQSKRWRQLAADHIELVYNEVKSFVTMLAKHITNEERINLEIVKQVNENLATHMSEAEKELQILVEDEQRQPITYNHYYTDNIQEARQNASRDLIHKIVKDTADDDFHGAMHISNNGIDVKRLVGALQKRVIVDMDEQACSEVRAGLDAYYKVARKTFVDNVCKQIIERHLLRPLPNLFSPETVAAYTEDDLGRVAAESDQAIVKRRNLLSLHGGLMESLAELNHP